VAAVAGIGLVQLATPDCEQDAKQCILKKQTN
jgi:hypothetical protein